MSKYYFFWKHRLSQWHKCDFIVDQITYNCAEQYMMAQKALLFEDLASHSRIMRSSDPQHQQRYGREVLNFDLTTWNKMAKAIVYTGNYARFKQNQDQQDLLVSTAPLELVEASPYDRIWGIGLRESDPNAQHKHLWRGTNWLGEVLTQVRDQIIYENSAG